MKQSANNSAAARTFCQFLALLIFLSVSACTQKHHKASIVKRPISPQKEFIKGDEFIILTARKGDTPQKLAKNHLGSEARAWEITSFNNITKIATGDEIIIPLKPVYPLGIFPDGYQTIPVLCYHRFGTSPTRMTVTPESFARQMAFLADNGYSVIQLDDLKLFLDGKLLPPPKSVVLTFDDGYKSFYEIAYPVLRKYNFPATVFVYNDFIGSRAGLSWQEIDELLEQGLVDIQPHSNKHTNLGLNQLDENDSDYEKRLQNEIKIPTVRFQERMKKPMHSFAYPYGDTNHVVIQKLKALDYKLGVTVQPGPNPGFSSPFMLRRSMVFGDDGLEKFKQHLATFTETELR